MATTHTPTSQLIADHMRSAPTFPATPAPQHQSAWHQQGGISHRTLIHFPTALLRPALSSAAVPGSAAGVPLVCVGNKAFVAGQQDRATPASTNGRPSSFSVEPCNGSARFRRA